MRPISKQPYKPSWRNYEHTVRMSAGFYFRTLLLKGFIDAEEEAIIIEVAAV